VRTLRAGEADVVRSGDRATIRHDGAFVPFAPLARLLGGEAPRGTRRFSVVVLAAGGRLAALGVDRVRGTSAEVVRSLPAAAGRAPTVAGAALDPEGNPRLVLDPGELVARATTGVATETLAPPPKRAPVLVIDDSLTTRMLEQSILESAGYEVELATSAEEGLEKARARTFGVFVVDVEMPGMDGYEFVARTRKDPALGRTPAILVTSRGSPEDRRRGAEAGASAYIVKGEFDQGRLLSAIAELMR
jgi:two-component system chemotaxis sensor kinase CheA